MKTFSNDPECEVLFYGISDQTGGVQIDNSTGIVQIMKLNESMSETIEFYVKIGT